MILVTGASGFLGWHVARVLIERGQSVRALVRPGSRVSDLRRGDRYRRSARPCLARARRRRAASRSFTWPPITACGPAIRANCTGPTSRARGNLLEAARAAGVERVVYTSTVGCIGIPHGGIGDETTPGDPGRHGRPLQTLEVSGRAGGAGIRPRRTSGGDRQSDRAHRRVTT